MNIYETYSDKSIRNKPNQDELERAFTEMQAQETADKLYSKYASEPRFLTEITLKLADRLRKDSDLSSSQNPDLRD